jgi:hypothetical protein
VTYFDVFNGDADGICALHQLRLAEPTEATLVTGVKRDISLLRNVDAAPGDQITVLDVSLDKNRDALLAVLAKGAQVRFFDHHFAGEIPTLPGLQAYIDTAANVCTSLLVNQFLNGQHLVWAVVAAFGDNLAESARAAAQPLALRDPDLLNLQELGECLNYNAYGENLDDLFYHPAELYRIVHQYADPFVLIDQEPAFKILRDGYRQDMARAQDTLPAHRSSVGSIYILPDDAWARRVSGVFGNALASSAPNHAHAVLTSRSDGGFLVSVRAPTATRSGADELCRQFATGGGRKAAAGINHLPEAELHHFIERFDQAFSSERKS